MQEGLVKTGIDVIGGVPWGTHFCQFYQSKQDLLDILVPYLKAGLENNEFCMWVTAEPLNEGEARAAIAKAIPDFAQRQARGQIEILPHDKWYLKDGVFDMQRVLNGWVDKLNQALATGYAGMRVTGNTAWLERNGWKDFTEYEAEINNVIDKYKMMALCTYWLDKCGASEVIDVVSNHQFALLKKQGRWQIIESAIYKQTKEALAASEERFRDIFQESPIGIEIYDSDGVLITANKACLEIFGVSDVNEVMRFKLFQDPNLTDEIKKRLQNSETVKYEGPFDFEKVRQHHLYKTSKTGVIYLDVLISPLGASAGKVHSGYMVHVQDITERKKIEEAQKESQRDLSHAQEVACTGNWRLDVRRNELLWSDETYRIFDIPRETPMTYETFLSAIHPEDREYVDRKWTAALHGDPYDIEHRIVVDNGIKWVREKAELEFDKKGALLGGFGTVQDITERKKAEEALLREKNFSTAIIDHLPGFFYIIDRNGHFIRSNRDAEKVTGYSAQELPGMHCLKVIAEKDRDFITGKIEEVFAKGSATAEANLLKKDGTETSYLFTGASVAIGDSTYLLGMGIDIAERKHAEAMLLETRDYLENLLNYANAPIIVWDPSFRITRFNHAFERLTGLSASSVLGKKLDVLFPETEREESMAHIRRAVAGERWEVVEIPILRTYGTVRTVLWNSATLYSADGKTAIATIAQGQDITERKEAEEALRETRDYLNNLLDYANAPIIVWDPSFRITRFNHAFERLTGLSWNQVVGKQLDILFPEDKREESLTHIRRAVAGERWEVVEIPILRTDGTVRTVLWNSATLYAADGKTAIATIAQGQDITERKQAGEEIIKLNEALREQAAELEASNKELESFSYSVSHDLREPLRTVDGFSRILQKDYADKLDAEGQRLINIVRGGTQKMAKLISDLLSFSRIGRKHMELSEIDMGETVRSVSAELRSAVPERRLRFNIKKLPAAQGDPAMIRQVMVNLLSNAIKFTRDKPLALIEVGSMVQDGESIYYVKDNGVGFDPQYMDKLFSIFQRLHSEEEFEGTGVGLAIVQRIVYRHGGRVWAEGKVGHGATFYFTLPGKEGGT